MLQNKDITKIQEIKMFFKDTWVSPEFFKEYLDLFKFHKISIKFRQQAYETIGGLFKDVKQDFIEHKLDERIMIALVELIAVLDFLIEYFDIEITISKLIRYNEKFDFLRKIQQNENICKLAV